MTVNVEDLKSYTDGLLNHVYHIEHDLSLTHGKSRRLTSINYNDIKERREDFLNALVNTVSNWVYNKALRNKILTEKEVESGDRAYAGAFLTNEANRKFRPGHPQGQFGELLLFNFLQHFFHAVPMLRKQRISTNVNLERNGADAIHYHSDGTSSTLFLGESKCYESNYSFLKAFKKSLSSIKDTFDNFDHEIGLYTYDEFIDPELLEVAKAYKNGTLKNVRFELVCLIIYNEHKPLQLKDELQIKDDILKTVTKHCLGLDSSCFSEYENLLDRIHFILFPIWTLEDLLEKFQKKVGSHE